MMSGWEVTCYVTTHREHGRPCRKTLTCSHHGGVEMTERKLKWWAWAGFRDDVGSRALHKELPLTEPAEGWPTLDALDAGDPAIDLVTLPRALLGGDPE